MQPSDLHVAVVSQNADIAVDMRPRAMARSLAQAGYRVSLVAPARKSNGTLALDLPGVEPRLFQLPRPAGGVTGQLREQAQAAARAAAMIASIARVAPIHILQVGNPPDNGWLFPSVVRLAQGFSPAFVYDQHDPAPLLAVEKFGQRRHARLIERVLAWLESKTFEHADLVLLANAPFLERACRSEMLRSRGIVAPNGWSLPECPMGVGLPWRDSTVPLLTYVGTTNTQDCIEHLVEAIRAISVPVQLVVAGDGEARAGAEELARRGGVADRITWLGWVTDRRLIASLVASADACVAPETSSEVNDITSFVKLSEYMSLGAAVVAHRLPQTEVIGGDALEYAEDESAAGLAAAVERVLTNPDRAADHRHRARRRFDETLRWESAGGRRVVEGYADMFLQHTVGRQVSDARC